MEEIENVKKALRIVERYENYLIRRAWGTLFIVFGVSGFLGSFIAFNAQAIAGALGVSPELFLSLVSTMIFIVNSALVAYAFGSATRSIARARKVSFRRDALHAVAIMAIWFVCFALSGFAPEPLQPAAWLWAAAAASFLSHIVLRRVQEHVWKELLILSIVMIIVSIPTAFVSDATLARYVATVSWAVTFFITGMYVLATASRTLGE